MRTGGSFLDGRTGQRLGPQHTFKDRIWQLLQPTEEEWRDWKWHFRNRITSIERLAQILPLEDAEKTRLQVVVQRYPFAITPHYLSLVKDESRLDPILRQALPAVEECADLQFGREDPLEELRHMPAPGLIHRYPDRVLMLVTNLCSVLCRFCTRKREWGNGGWARPWVEIERAVEYIRRNRTIRDVIVSGGDPLTLENARLARILAALRSIPHVEIIRIGTRYPVVLPQRIDAEFCQICDHYGPIWLNTHFNHPDEISPESASAVRELLRAGVPVNNQSVLLRDVNDSVETQMRLGRELLRIGVRPYYLYQADEVRGTEHFWTPLESGLEIIEGLQGHTSGLAVPLFVVDLAGGGGKVVLQPPNLVSHRAEESILRNYEGRTFSVRSLLPIDVLATNPQAEVAMA